MKCETFQIAVVYITNVIFECHMRWEQTVSLFPSQYKAVCTLTRLMFQQICVQLCKLFGRRVRHEVVQVVWISCQIVVLDKVLGVIKLAVHRVGRVGQRTNTSVGVVFPVAWIDIVVMAFNSSNTARTFSLERQLVVNVGMTLQIHDVQTHCRESRSASSLN